MLPRWCQVYNRQRGDDLDEGILDNLHIAGERMRRLLSLLEGRRL